MSPRRGSKPRLTDRLVVGRNVTLTNLRKYYKAECIRNQSQDSSVGIATNYRLDGRGSIPSMARGFSVLHSVQTGFRAHPASYPMGTGGSFPGIKAAGA
jgi:hypothetical protein